MSHSTNPPPPGCAPQEVGQVPTPNLCPAGGVDVHLSSKTPFPRCSPQETACCLGVLSSPSPRFPAPRRLPGPRSRPPRCGSSRGAPGLDRATANGALRLVARAGDELASAVPNSAIPSSNPKCQPGLFF